MAIRHNRRAVFEFIVAYKIAHDGNSPSMREIGQQFGISSLSMVDYILDDLVDQGKIRRDGTRGIYVTGGQWNLVGDNQA